MEKLLSILTSSSSKEELAERSSELLGEDYILGIKKEGKFWIFRSGKEVGKIKEEEVPQEGEFEIELEGKRIKGWGREGFFLGCCGKHKPSSEILKLFELAFNRIRFVERYRALREEVEELSRELRKKEDILFDGVHSKISAAVITSIGHKINNKLTAVIGYSQMLLYELREDERWRPKVEKIVENSTAVSQQMQKAMAFFQKWSGGFDSDLLTTVRKVLDEYRDIFAEKKIKVKERLSDSLSSVAVDQNLMGYALREVLKNALEALEKIEERFFFIVGDREDDVAYVKFHNSAPPEQLSKVEQAFEPFFTTKPYHWGLGLNLVHGIVSRLHGGNVDIFKEKDGVSVQIELPVRKIAKRGKRIKAVLVSKREEFLNMAREALERDFSGLEVMGLAPSQPVPPCDLLFVEMGEAEIPLEEIKSRALPKVMVVFGGRRLPEGVKWGGDRMNLMSIYRIIKEEQWKI